MQKDLQDMPEEVVFQKNQILHYFKFQINIEKGLLVVGYKHFLSEVVGEEIGGMTNIWCNPFEGNKIVDYLIEKITDSKGLKKELNNIYKFLVDNKIVK